MFQIIPWIGKDRRDPIARNSITTIVFLESGTLSIEPLSSHVLRMIDLFESRECSNLTWRRQRDRVAAC
jgi:hypothetical protein